MLISANKYELTPSSVYGGTSGSIGMEKISFSFSDDWDGLIKKVVFYPVRGQPVEISPYRDGEEIEIPPEITRHSGEASFVVSGYLLSENVIAKKLYSLTGTVIIDHTQNGDGVNSEKVTPDSYDRLLSEVKNEIEDKLTEAALSGEFDGADGISPTVSVSQITNGHKVTITDRDGEKSFNVSNGAKGETGAKGDKGDKGDTGATGAKGDKGDKGDTGSPGTNGVDGVSPTVTTKEISGGFAVTITDKNGSRTINVMNGDKGDRGEKGEQGNPGTDGKNGADGVSPTVTTERVRSENGNYGYKITITDKNGDKAFSIYDGDKGEQGEQGVQGNPGADGNDGVSPDVSVSKTGRTATITITDADGDHTFSLIDGKDGTDGKNFAILGYFSSLEALQAAIETPTAGMAYGIGASAPYDIYVYDAVSETWKNNGSLSGVKGDDGFSPTIEIETVSNGHRVTVTDKNGSQSFNVTNGTDGTNGTNGQDGAKGEDGFSPTITVTEITNGHRVSITDKDGTGTFDVMNGQNGAAGSPGKDGTNGKDGADGVSPTITLTDIDGGTKVSVTDKNGTQTFNVMDGAKGEQGSPGKDGANGTDGTNGTNGTDGISPTVSVAEISNGHSVTITDKNGAKSFNVTNGTNGTNGQDGAKGEDGFSPTITVTQITNGHRVSISAKDGSTSSFDVMNGEKGDQGNPGSDATVTVDSEMSTTSENPVQNKVVSAAISSAISSQTSETWTFTLKSGSTVTKTVVLK